MFCFLQCNRLFIACFWHELCPGMHCTCFPARVSIDVKVVNCGSNVCERGRMICVSSVEKDAFPCVADDNFTKSHAKVFSWVADT